MLLLSQLSNILRLCKDINVMDIIILNVSHVTLLLHFNRSVFIYCQVQYLHMSPTYCTLTH